MDHLCKNLDKFKTIKIFIYIKKINEYCNQEENGQILFYESSTKKHFLGCYSPQFGLIGKDDENVNLGKLWAGFLICTFTN